MCKKLSFLIIDDSYIDRIVASAMIKTVFTENTISETGGATEGLQFLQEKKHITPLIILLDVKMPQVDGFGFLDQFEHANEIDKSEITIFMLSSTIDPDDIRKAEKNPFVKKLLSKPLSIQQLKHNIDLLG
jgi:response regulator RpfG family c-di-GMP phosphodiesterase